MKTMMLLGHNQQANCVLYRFVEKLKQPVSEALDEGVSNEASPLSKLAKIWGSGVIKDQILESLERHWKELAHQGRSLEEIAR